MSQLPSNVASDLGGHLEILSIEWNQESVNKSNEIFESYKDQGPEVWSAFFRDFFSTRAFTDDLKNYLGYPTFFWLSTEVHVNLQAALFRSLSSNQASLLANASNLSSELNSNDSFRTTLLNTNQFFNNYFKYPDGQTHLLYEEILQHYTELTSNYRSLLKKPNQIALTEYPYAGIIRSQIYANLSALHYIQPSRKEAIAETIGILDVADGFQKDLWNEFGIVVADNGFFSERQFERIYRVFSAVPKHLHRTVSINVTNVIEENVHLVQSIGSFNLFDIEVGQQVENGFPVEVAPHYADLFTLVLVHEVNHLIDDHSIEQPENELRAHKNKILASAGSDSLNYLRSVIPSDFFVENPQEFFASMANMYFANTSLTFEAALKRASEGRFQPLNQFLLFASVYTDDSDSTAFFSFDESSNFATSKHKVGRNSSGFITDLYFDKTCPYHFGLDDANMVVALSTPYQSSGIEPPVLVAEIQTACISPGSSVDIDFQVSTTAPDPTYRLYSDNYFNNTVSESDDGIFNVPNLSGDTIFYVTAVSNGCESDFTSIGVTLRYLPDNPLISISGDNGEILESSYSSNNQWFFNDVEIEGATNYQYVANESGRYSVRHTADNGCAGLSDYYEYVAPLGLEDDPDQKKVFVYPNPTRGKNELNIEGVSLSAEYQMYDINGSIVKNSSIKMSGSVGWINVSNLKPGVYILHISERDRTYLLKVFRD